VIEQEVLKRWKLVASAEVGGEVDDYPAWVLGVSTYAADLINDMMN